MKPGTPVRITGWRNFTGTVLAASDLAMVIQEGPGLATVLRRDPASTKPMQWQCAGLPVEVHAIPDLTDFRRRLRDLERKTRS